MLPQGVPRLPEGEAPSGKTASLHRGLAGALSLAGRWWVTSGAKFDPDSTVPMPPGSFIRRVARTPHYDGVKRDAKEPAVIAICGMGPITFHNTEEGTPSWRQV
jgi:hypothetical protein